MREESMTLYAIEIEKVGPGGYVTRYVDSRGRPERFATREAAQRVADHLDAQANTYPGHYTRYEVIEIPARPYRAERDPLPPSIWSELQ
jgi:hypothetical protein